MLGINGAEFIALLVIAAIVVGPERLPRYAEQLADLVRAGRDYLAKARTRVDQELGEDLKDVDWASLDPRRYDPRRIVRDALLDDSPQRAAPAAAPAAARGAEDTAGPAPFDDEAT
ncbi:MAG: Sec-independent protein translocase TatB [Cellulomonadaceae bacterium]